MTATLYGIHQSAWTERARWALDHHQVAYHFHEHVPLVGELLLRRKARVKKASVPLFADGDRVVMGSAEIARHAEGIGSGAKLFTDPAASPWIDVAERLAEGCRACFFEKARANPALQRESVPKFVPGALVGLAAPSVAMAIRYLGRKWDTPTDIATVVATRVRPALNEVRTGLAGKAYLLGGFSFADIAIASTLGAVKPRTASRFGPATRAAWTVADVAEEFRDLLDWRDGIYAGHCPVT